MAELDKEVFDVPEETVVEEETHEIVEPKKKGKKAMSPERKEQLKEQLRLAREKKKALKLAGKEVAKGPKTVKVLEATTTEPAIYVKNVRSKKQVDHTQDIEELKSQIAELKAHNSKADKEELIALRKEMKEIKELEKTNKKKVAEYKKPPPKAPAPKVKAPPVEESVKVAPRYSTYQKSIWSQFL